MSKGKQELNLNDFSDLLTKKDGVWISKKKTKVSYPTEGNDLYFKVENKSLWFDYRNKFIVEILTQFPPTEPTISVGAGNGVVEKEIIKKGYKVIALEPGMQGIRNAQKRGIKDLVLSDFESAEFIRNSIPSVFLFDVLEHLDEDNDFLKSIFKCLAPKGRLYLTVPAYNFLWSRDDILAGHKRRYTKNSIKKTLKKSGYEVEFCSYVFSSLFFPMILLKVIPFRLGLDRTKSEEEMSNEHIIKNKFVRLLLELFLGIEKFLINKKMLLPFGSSLIVVARKEG